MVARNGCSERQDDALYGCIGHVSHHLGPLLGVVELIVLCAFVCKVRYVDAQIREALQVDVRFACLFGKM